MERDDPDVVPGPDPRFVLIGAAGLAAGAAGQLLSAAGRLLRLPGAPLRAGAGLLPRPARARVEKALVDLDRQGRRLAGTGGHQAADVVASVAGTLTGDPAVVGVIEDLVDRLQWRVVDAVLPAVLDRLNAEPDQVRVLVRGQSRGAAEEVTNAARAQAERSDRAVEAFLGRILHRELLEQPVTGPPRPHPAGTD